MIFRLNQSIALWMLRFSRCSDESNVSDSDLLGGAKNLADSG